MINILVDTPTPPTQAVKLAQTIAHDNSAILQSAIISFRQAFGALWNVSATPQDIFDEFDTNAGVLLDTLQARLDFIEAIAIAHGDVLNDYISSAERTPPFTATVNMDGTVTVT